jgi:hypothetical protein
MQKHNGLPALTVELEIAYRVQEAMYPSGCIRPHQATMRDVSESLALQYSSLPRPDLLPVATEHAAKARPELEPLLAEIYDGIINIQFNQAYPASSFRALRPVKGVLSRIPSG